MMKRPPDPGGNNKPPALSAIVPQLPIFFSKNPLISLHSWPSIGFHLSLSLSMALNFLQLPFNWFAFVPVHAMPSTGFAAYPTGDAQPSRMVVDFSNPYRIWAPSQHRLAYGSQKMHLPEPKPSDLLASGHGRTRDPSFGPLLHSVPALLGLSPLLPGDSRRRFRSQQSPAHPSQWMPALSHVELLQIGPLLMSHGFGEISRLPLPIWRTWLSSRAPEHTFVVGQVRIRPKLPQQRSTDGPQFFPDLCAQATTTLVFS